MSKRNTLLLIFFIFLLSNCKKTSNESATPSFKLEFEDDFSGTYVDQSKWSLYNSPGNAGFGLRRPEAFSVVDGNLIVTAQMVNGMLVSGGMCRKTAMTYGKYEFRVRTENDTSESTSGVILTWPQSNRCPEDGENDMYETGTDPNRSSFHTFIHYGTSPHTQYLYEHSVDATKWQIVSMEWTIDYIKIYRNNKLVWVVTDQVAIPDVPHVVCIQLDAWKQTMSGTVRMYVDWIKVYSLEN
jgi:beta-glucanase (GH16 family)